MNYETRAHIKDIHDNLTALGFGITQLEAKRGPVFGDLRVYGKLVYRKDRQCVVVLKSEDSRNCYLMCDGEDDNTRTALLRFSTPNKEI